MPSDVPSLFSCYKLEIKRKSIASVAIYTYTAFNKCYIKRMSVLCRLKVITQNICNVFIGYIVLQGYKNNLSIRERYKLFLVYLKK